MINKKIKVAVAMSGGVDSSIAAYLLLQKKKYDVTGIYMRNWSEELPEIKGCPWETDQRDAQLVAAQLGIPFYVVNFEQEYYHQVVQYMIDNYQQGLTPNPDMMCNQEIKFGVFLEKIRALGFDLMATGHYAQIYCQHKKYFIKQAQDLNKDQSYFLARLNSDQISKALFPLGNITKPEVRALAKKLKLVVADKKDSQGICFIGNIKVRDFLQRKFKGTPGNIIDLHNKKILGQHQGVEFFTIGQREGIEVGGTGPYYVVSKNLRNGDLLVTNNINDDLLFTKKLTVQSVRWLLTEHNVQIKCGVRIRYRDKIIPCQVQIEQDNAQVKLDTKQRAVTPGQIAVFYNEQGIIIGSGIIA